MSTDPSLSVENEYTKDDNIAHTTEEEDDEEEDIPDYSQWQLPKSSQQHSPTVELDEEYDEDESNIDDTIASSIKKIDKIQANVGHQAAPTKDLGTQKLFDQIGTMKKQIGNQLANQLSSLPEKDKSSAKPSKKGLPDKNWDLPVVKLDNLDLFSDSDDDDALHGLSYDDWKEQQQLKKKQHALNAHLKKEISPTSLFDRLTAIEKQQPLSQPLFKPQMSDAEHMQFLRWMFPLASSLNQ